MKELRYKHPSQTRVNELESLLLLARRTRRQSMLTLPVIDKDKYGAKDAELINISKSKLYDIREFRNTVSRNSRLPSHSIAKQSLYSIMPCISQSKLSSYEECVKQKERRTRSIQKQEFNHLSSSLQRKRSDWLHGKRSQGGSDIFNESANHSVYDFGIKHEQLLEEEEQEEAEDQSTLKEASKKSKIEDQSSSLIFKAAATVVSEDKPPKRDQIEAQKKLKQSSVPPRDRKNRASQFSRLMNKQNTTKSRTRSLFQKIKRRVESVLKITHDNCTNQPWRECASLSPSSKAKEAERHQFCNPISQLEQTEVDELEVEKQLGSPPCQEANIVAIGRETCELNTDPTRGTNQQISEILENFGGNLHYLNFKQTSFSRDAKLDNINLLMEELATINQLRTRQRMQRQQQFRNELTRLQNVTNPAQHSNSEDCNSELIQRTPNDRRLVAVERVQNMKATNKTLNREKQPKQQQIKAPNKQLRRILYECKNKLPLLFSQLVASASDTMIA